MKCTCHLFSVVKISIKPEIPIPELYWNISKVSWGRTQWEPRSCHTRKKIPFSYQACCLSNILLVVSFTSEICINTMCSTSVLMLLPFHFTERLLIKVLLGRCQGSPVQPSLSHSWLLYLNISSPPNQMGLIHLQTDTSLEILVPRWPFWLCSGSFW